MAIAPLLTVFAHDSRHHIFAHVSFERVQSQTGSRVRIHPVAELIVKLPGRGQDRVVEFALQSEDAVFVWMRNFNREVEPVDTREAEWKHVCAVSRLQYFRRRVGIEALIQPRLLKLVRCDKTVPVLMAELVDYHLFG